MLVGSEHAVPATFVWGNILVVTLRDSAVSRSSPRPLYTGGKICVTAIYGGRKSGLTFQKFTQPTGLSFGSAHLGRTHWLFPLSGGWRAGLAAESRCRWHLFFLALPTLTGKGVLCRDKSHVICYHYHISTVRYGNGTTIRLANRIT